MSVQSIPTFHRLIDRQMTQLSIETIVIFLAITYQSKFPDWRRRGKLIPTINAN